MQKLLLLNDEKIFNTFLKKFKDEDSHGETWLVSSMKEALQVIEREELAFIICDYGEDEVGVKTLLMLSVRDFEKGKTAVITNLSGKSEISRDFVAGVESKILTENSILGGGF